VVAVSLITIDSRIDAEKLMRVAVLVCKNEANYIRDIRKDGHKLY
jgi:hypothetical protein